MDRALTARSTQLPMRSMGPPTDYVHHSTWLDLLRWCSACLVVVGHIRSFLFLEYPEIG
jgi:hypothetical protein